MRNEHENIDREKPDELRDKAVRLFTYLKEVCQLRFVVVRDCRNYDHLLWFHDIPREPECFCIAWNGPTETNESWIEVRRGVEPVCPPVPIVCKDWISPADLMNSAQTPTLRERILAPVREGEPPSHVELSQQPGVQAKWQEYLKTKWEAWAKEHRRWKSVQQVYGNLFSIYQQQKRLGESFELRIGLGLLSWQSPTGERIYRHILAGQANINFDANRGVISISAAAEGVKLALEHDMLDPSQLPTPEQHQAVEDGVQANAETPWDKNLIEPLLRQWVHAMNERGRFDDSLQPSATASSIPQVTFAPALILRRRTARTLVKLLTDIAKNIEQGGAIPFGVQRLCNIVDDIVPDADDETVETTKTGQSADTETYFPLPANDEQSKIAQRLSTGRGVLVQGPPGTGKSHTIANLICHLLAKGKRVLVTSQTPRALKVLQDKIPRELSALCVSILGNDTGALKNMENSVLGITERHHDWEAGGKERNAQNMGRVEDRLYAGRKRLAEIETRLHQLRELETYRHSIAGGAYQGTAAHIAQKLVADREHFGWLPDSVDEKQELPLPAASFLTVLQLLRGLQPARCAELGRPFVAIAELPDVDTFVRIATDERAAKEVCQSHSAREASPSYKTLVRCGKEERSVALEKLQALQTAVGNIRRRPLPWIPDAIHGVLSDQDRPWRELLHATVSALENLCERARNAHARRVQLPDGIDRQQVLADARDLHGHLNNGGNLGFLFIRSAVVRRTLYLTKQIRVNGRVCATTEMLSELVEHLDLEIHVETLWGYWVGIVERMNGPLPRQVTELEECQEALELVVALIPYLDEAKASVKNLRGISEPAWHDAEAVGSLIADLQATAARDSLVNFDAQLSPVVHTLACAEIRPNAHPVNAVLSKAVLNRDTKAYSDAWNELRQLTEDKQQLENRETIFQSIKKHTPRFATMLAGDFANPTWDDRLSRIEEAWNWSRANAWLHEFHRDQDAEKLETEVKSLQRNLQHSMAELAAEKAWRHCFDRLTEAQRQHLMAWTNAVRRIGRGTGVRAEIHRRNARMHMDECRGAVPAWIMPFYRLAETIDAKPESFDVVIVDEASQSGPDTLALLYLAKQIIVVGDDQQISPEAVGVQRADVDLLSERLISDLPHRDALGVESSLFNQAVIRFGRRIVLREHFRCVPEIIRFSNDLCYTATPLIPLRQYPPERLEPIVVRHVTEGFREGDAGYARNKPEAEVLVKAIVQCTKDPRYLCAKDDHHPDGKLTFGVISLQGEEQAKLINQLLLEHLMPEEIEQRELVCGDAYAFQGDERDVMFLSMVAAPNQRFAALVKESDKQRFNVAASRGRDQVWLFHTVTLNELNPDDMRYKLLAYYSNPTAQPAGKPDWEKCESDFEREVGKIIYAKNFRLIPQYEPFGPGSYRIDFVIEGLKSRLAVECDGPHHDDPEQIERDMARQRQLERCKWVFWRVSASGFYFDREKAMSSLWCKLEELGIQPLTETVPTNLSQISSPIKPTSPPPTTFSPVSHDAAKSPGPSRQPELIPSNQMELPDPRNCVSTDRNYEDVRKCTISPSLRDYILSARQKRPHGALIYEEIGLVVLEIMPKHGRINRNELIRNAAEILDFSDAAFKRVDEAICRLEELKKVNADSNHVWRLNP
jgi:very-short-patch-repair endonuclease